MKVRTVLVVVLAVSVLVAAPQRARADDPPADADADAESGPDRPSSGVLSLWSGRTLGNGHAAVAAGVGWPGLFVELVLAPSSRFNIGGRVQVNYGSPLMGIGTGIGGDVQIPVRYHFYAHDDLDLALAIRPGFTFGQGALVGQRGVFANDFGWGVRLDTGVLLGWHASDALTLTFGLLAGAGLSDVSGTDLELIGSFYATTALEIVVSRDTLLFAMLDAGYGLARAERFDTTVIFRLWLGLAYEL